ncbi:MAG: sugar phosphate isomerase/epimerase [Armatimonadetes bacterium]|nr:sugar phosphate isomerase/epimerase [Armatimonadota bacterium]
MPKIAVFGDEIAPEIDRQVEVMTAAGVHALELRGAEGHGVLDLRGDVRERIRTRLQAAGVEVFSIGSPIGKVPLESPRESELERLKVAVEQAWFFGAPRIRVFSFYLPDHDYPKYRDEVVHRMGKLAALAAASAVVLCHENEAGIYGEPIANCVDMLRSVDSPALRAVHDTSNFVVAHEEAYPAAYEALQPWLDYYHIKDHGHGKVQPAGEGEGRMPELFARLKADGFDGYLSLEPHLGGGAEAFGRAARALRKLVEGVGWVWR